MKRPAIITFSIIFAVLLIDQVIKISIKTHMWLGHSHPVAGHWFYLHFVENPGMAFGITFNDGNTGKMLLSIFRLLAVAGIGWYLLTLLKKKVRPLLIVCVSLIFAGAMGNILDSLFYGIIFERSDLMTGNIAHIFPKGGGYAGFLQGWVVDMFHFPIFTGHFPHWLPKWGGEEFEFFSPIFNIADASISVGVFLLIVFQKRLFSKQLHQLSARRILATNVFFGILLFFISSFLLLTFFALYSTDLSEQYIALSGAKKGIAFALAFVIGAGAFFLLQRVPVFVPATDNTSAVAASAEETALHSTPEENGSSAPDDSQS